MTPQPVINKIDADAIKSEFSNNSTGEAKIAHDSVLRQIIEHCTEPIDFYAEAAVGKGGKLALKHFVVLTVRVILMIAKAINCGLCRSNGTIFTFNGEFWNQIDGGDLKIFLSAAAKKLGVDDVTADYHSFAEELYKQFLTVAHLPKAAWIGKKVLINLQNGTFEIKRGIGKLRDFSRADFLTHQLGFGYDKTAVCPKWRAFLDEVLPDRASQDLLAEYVAYVFARHLKLEKTLILFGNGANGKSVVFEVINALLGSANVSNYSLESLGDQYYRAMIAHKLLNYSSENSTRLQSEKFKQLTSGEPIEARLPYGQPMTITNYARLAFNTNELPRDVEHTEAYFRRFLIIPFDVTIPEERRNPNLPSEIIETELSGVFNWVLDGLSRLLKANRFSECEASHKAVDNYRRESDSVALFIDENSYVKSTSNYESLKDFYPIYKTFCLDNGMRPVHSRNLIKRLEGLGFETYKMAFGKIIYIQVGA